MYRMYYLSTAVKGLTAADHEDVLKKARRNNRELNVTGLLVVKGEHFVQALEGEKEAVLTLFEKIKRDKRHTRVVLLSQGEVEERLFSNWEMGFRDVTTTDQLSSVDLENPRFVSNPKALDEAFRCAVEYEVHA